jgi:hypothetical protein
MHSYRGELCKKLKKFIIDHFESRKHIIAEEVKALH